MELRDRVVVITGSSSNIGKATALKFAEQGARVVVNSKSNLEGGRQVVEEIRSKKAKAIYIQADVSEPEEVRRLFRETMEQFGTVDILINNAGHARTTPFFEATKEDWLEAFDNNFFGTVLCSQEAARIMQERGGGKILNTSSVRGISHAGRQGLIAYSAAKAAVINFTKTLAKQLAPTISVNAVAPGFVYVPNYETFPKEVREGFIKSTPLGRYMEVTEIAEAFLYLSRADGITGIVLVVDGGFSLKLA
jgi:3-oxoacyl-[acyl-carrier protein] reductase